MARFLKFLTFLLQQRVCAGLCFDGSGEVRLPYYSKTFSVRLRLPCTDQYDRWRCETSHLATPLLVVIRCVLYRHCYGTEAHVPQCPSHALCKTSVAKAFVAENYLGDGMRRSPSMAYRRVLR